MKDPALKTDELSKAEMMQLHWSNFQFRQSHIWRNLNRLIFATVVLWAIPFINPTLFKTLSIFILFFPFVAVFLSWTGRRLLKEEYQRLGVVIKKFDDLTPDIYKPDWSDIKKGKIGSIVFNEICYILISLSIVDLLLITGMLFFSFPQPA